MPPSNPNPLSLSTSELLLPPGVIIRANPTAPSACQEGADAFAYQRAPTPLMVLSVNAFRGGHPRERMHRILRDVPDTA